MTIGDRIIGSLGKIGGAGSVRLEDRFATTPEDLWEAMTEPGRLARWYGEVSGDLRQGGEFAVHVAAAGLDATGRVEECAPPHRLRVTTRETEESAGAGNGPAPFDESIEVTLTADGDQTLLVIEVSGLPLDKVAAYGAGWQLHVESLAAHLEGFDAPDADSRWQVLIPAYAEQAGALG